MINIPEYKNAEKVFSFFEEISKIPHCSGNTEKLASFLVDFAKERDLFFIHDSTGNVIIRKPATKGYENRPTVIVQGHIDMVEAVDPDCKKNMKTDGIDIYRDGDFIRARGTTLGADDGIAVAYAMALLDSNDIPHPEIEAVFTTDEEIALDGAKGLDTTCLHGRMMINVDAASEGLFIAGCAGGVNAQAELPMRQVDESSDTVTLTVSGIKGGHSGSKIGKGGKNAIKILGELLKCLSESDNIMLSSISGGNASNAIPKSARATVKTSLLTEKIKDVIYAISEKYRDIEPDITITAEKSSDTKPLYSVQDTRRAVGIICDTPNGVVAMSRDIDGLVETSLNLGLISSGDGGISLTFSIRSSVAEKKEEVFNRIKEVALGYGASVNKNSDYPAWEYRRISPLRDTMCQTYKRMYGTDARTVVIHAGLECGIFADKIDGLDCVSIGPSNFDLHTTNEHLSISSTARVWDFLKEVLKNI